ncbi:G-box binding factor 3, putative isoform 2 [Hibiscus syriacus]|uniref:G-box binding factor 3, putative isoform 2 n=1 Tax=Hibiscus syriacus TaxID=106335 RepID=A0A6A2Z1D4_HIBSY|nr:G-box binding factor 3, putative isoform 2 [Hibiscus syriacus]
MGNSDEGKSSKSDKSSSPSPPDQSNIHVYPGWAAMQPIMPPYATIYPHGEVYVHPAIAMGSHGLGIPSSPPVRTKEALAPVETPTKSSGNKNKGLMKKLKGFDGLAMSIGNSSAEKAEGGDEPRPSQSLKIEGSTDDSDGNTAGADQTRRKRSREGTETIGGEGNDEARSKPVAMLEVTATISPIPAGLVLSPGMTTALELRNSHTMNAKSSPMSLPGVMPSEVWMQNERELKRERRKQSNRESARRSRLRKQAEAEELACKVESLTAENSTIRSEIIQLTEKSKKLTLENATLVEGLKNSERGYAEEIAMNKKEDKDGETYVKKSNLAAKLRQLLDPSPRANAVAA